MKKIFMAFAVVPIIYMSACVDMEDSAEASSMPVIEGWIDSDGYPVVLYSSSIVPGIEGSLSSNVVTIGSVKISDGTESVMLTGAPANEYVPPFKYYTYEMRGMPGKIYSLTALCPGFDCSAEARMPEPTPIDSISCRPIMGNDTLRSVTVHFTAPEDVPAYYYLRIRGVMRDDVSRPALMGVAEARKAGEKMMIPVYHAKDRFSKDPKPFVPQPSVGEEFEVQLCRVEKEVWDFWRAYDNLMTFGTSQFIGGSVALPGNIRGGLGVFSPQGVSKSLVKVR